MSIVVFFSVEMNKQSVTPNKPAAAASQDDPFLIFETASSSPSSESFLDALEQISKLNNSKGTKGGSPSLKSPPKPMSKGCSECLSFNT